MTTQFRVKGYLIQGCDCLLGTKENKKRVTPSWHTIALAMQANTHNNSRDENPQDTKIPWQSVTKKPAWHMIAKSTS